jgi:outer membrane protein OmpA-like peptidoglycan-associated protein
LLRHEHYILGARNFRQSNSLTKKETLSMNKFIVALSALSLSAIASPAFAENFSLHLESGVAVNAGSTRDTNTFRPGIDGSAKLLFPIFTPNLAVGPSVSVVSLERNNDSSVSADLWGFGGTVRLQTNHSAKNNVVVWADATGSVDKQASLYRPGLAAAIGLDAGLDHNHVFSWGPFLGYSHAFDNTYKQQTELMPHRDVNIVLAGLSLSFDGAPKPVVKTVSVRVPVQVVQHDLLIVSTPAPSTPSITTEIVSVGTRVQFAHDSAALDSDSMAALDDVAKLLNDNPDYALVVQGVASSDGDETHNLKLSYLRAVSVVDYLANHGNVDRARLTAAALGEQGEAGDEKNRNANFVVFHLVPKN